MNAPARTLYDIGEDLRAIETVLLEIGGDVSDADTEALIDGWLAQTYEALEAKTDRYAALIQEISARATARKTEADRLAALATVDSNAVKRLKDRLQAFFESHDIRKVETPRFRVSLAANGGKLPVVLDCPEENVPEDYTKVRVEVDKTAIREAIEAGRVLDFAHLGERGRHLSIR